jgi:spermidine/putrescine transport system ATP-binding protein
MTDNAIELRDVTKVFTAPGGEEVTAVDQLTLDIHNGEFFSFLGPSGCGKTTTLRMIAGFEMPSEGQIYIQGKPMGYTPPYKRPVNTVFQNYALWPHMTVYQNVAFGLEMQKTPRGEIRRRVGDALALVQLMGYDNRRPKQLSGGQQQRVALARALVQRPAVLLLDEPLGALDLKLRKAMQLELKHIQRQAGITFIYVTHDQEEALTMSDRIAVMYQGCVQQCCGPEEIYERPATRYVADFIGETNFLEGRVTGVQNGWAEMMIDNVLALHAPTADEMTIGQGATIAIRPEKIGVQAQRAAGMESAVGRVEEVVYIGTDTRYIVQLTERTKVVARIQNLGGGVVTHYAPGAEVFVMWEPSAARLLTE